MTGLTKEQRESQARLRRLGQMAAKREKAERRAESVTTKLAVDGLKPISTNETRTICTHCSERFYTEDHPQHDLLTTR